MRISGKLVEEMGAQDVRSLVINGVRESGQLEFKRDLPGNADADKKEFLADATALANTDGGVIVFGIDTIRDELHKDAAVAGSLPGVPISNWDEEHQRLLSMLRDAVSPPLTRVKFHWVVVEREDRPVLLLGIAPSLDRPHKVTFKGQSRFYRRSEVGKYEPSVTELRRMFLESATWVEECEAFRRKRLNGFRNMPQLDGSSFVAVHLLPLGRLNRLLDMGAKAKQMDTNFPPLNQSSWNSPYNAQGFLTFAERQGQIKNYTQVFRFGGVEGYSSMYVDERDVAGKTRRVLLADSLDIGFENYVVESVKALKDVFDSEPPFCLMLTLTGVDRAIIPTSDSFDFTPIDQSDIELPPVVLEHDSDVLAECRRLMEVVWQAAGFDGRPKARRK